MPHDARRVAGCILLAGGLRASPLNVVTNCSVLDLWLGPGQTLLDRWIDAARSLGDAATLATLRVLHNQYVPAPRPDLIRRLVLLHDPRPYRGPAGVLRDVVDAGEHGTLVIAEAARVPPSTLADLVAEHHAAGADVTVVANPDETPAGLYLAEVASLDLVPARGYVDIKEHWLPSAVAAGLDVRVRHAASPVVPLVTREDLLQAALALQGETPPMAVVEAGRPHPASVICPGSVIGRDAIVAQSLVMPGAAIEAQAIVVRSVLLPHARVPAGAIVTDELVQNTHATAQTARRASQEHIRQAA